MKPRLQQLVITRNANGTFKLAYMGDGVTFKTEVDFDADAVSMTIKHELQFMVRSEYDL